MRRTGPYQVILATLTEIKVVGKNGWYHLNHCTQAQEPDAPNPLPERLQDPTPDTQADVGPDQKELAKELNKIKYKQIEERKKKTDLIEMYPIGIMCWMSMNFHVFISISI